MSKSNNTLSKKNIIIDTEVQQSEIFFCKRENNLSIINNCNFFLSSMQNRFPQILDLNFKQVSLFKNVAEQYGRLHARDPLTM